MRRRFALLAVAALGAPACGRTGGQAAAPATPAPAAASTAPAAHQHGQAGDTAAAHQHGAPAQAAPGAARPMMRMDSSAMRVRHNHHFRIGADSLAARLPSGNIVVVHVGRTDSAYLAGHIPGARFLPFSAISRTVNGIANEFPHPDSMAAAFTRLVIRDDQRIVLYEDGPGLMAARAWIALDLMGHGDRAALLDGGLTAWRAGNRPVDAGPIALPTVFLPFGYRWQAERLVDAAWVRTHLHDTTVVLVDARPADQFGGAETPCPPNQPACVNIPEARRGHIPGARNVPWVDNLVSREDPRLRSMHQLHHTVWAPAGADAPHVRTVVTYCRTGNQAALAYFAARYIGYRDVRFYDGSFIEWAGLPPDAHPVRRAPAGTDAHQHH